MEVDILTTCDECNGWLNPALAADAAVRRGDSILLIKRKFPPMQGAWALPGGFVERGENPINAAVREHDMSYSQFMNGVHKKGILLNRKALADLAMNEPACHCDFSIEFFKKVTGALPFTILSQYSSTDK